MAETTGARFERLVSIVRALRAPDGCPWDREQTHTSLKRFVLEETYEVLDAIDAGDPRALCEELGDFVFEAVLLAQLSDEAGDFSIADALQQICDKLVRRHPHVFDRDPGVTALTSEQVVEAWATLKARERALAGTPSPPSPSAIGGVPISLPALLRAHEISARAARVGFDWATGAEVLAKIEEEIAELREALSHDGSTNVQRVEDEMGDLLLAVANLARKLGIEPETALRRATNKFSARFDTMERTVAAEGQTLSALSPAELDAQWERAKAQS